MKDRKLATRYARALLGALPEAPAQNIADAYLAALAASMRSNGEFRSFLLNPANPTDAKKALLDQLSTAHGVPDRVVTFLRTVVDHGRIGNLAAIADVFHVEREAGQATVSATLTTAAPLPPELTARATAALERLAGRKVNLTSEVDASLLGGAIAKVGSMVYDGSLKTQLARLRRALGEE